MPNSENYERDPRKKLVALLNSCGWEAHGWSTWKKGDVCLLVDEVGVFLFRWLGSKWIRTHGLAHASMLRVAHTLEMVFLDGSKLNLEYGLFTPAPVRKRQRR
ncbi:MAG: hypothetical protein QME78_00270 [Thermodesulfobacteriota bacterium]|nr:hypothetical protein [Thermodesulfobacteriota bacterium]